VPRTSFFRCALRSADQLGLRVERQRLDLVEHRPDLRDDFVHAGARLAVVLDGAGIEAAAMAGLRLHTIAHRARGADRGP
jgi:hypothetical protein